MRLMYIGEQLMCYIRAGIDIHESFLSAGYTYKSRDFGWHTVMEKRRKIWKNLLTMPHLRLCLYFS